MIQNQIYENYILIMIKKEIEDLKLLMEDGDTGSIVDGRRIK